MSERLGLLVLVLVGFDLGFLRGELEIAFMLLVEEVLFVFFELAVNYSMFLLEPTNIPLVLSDQCIVLLFHR